MTDVVRGEFRSGPVPPWSRDFIRIISWNIERGLQFSKICDFLGAIQADLLLLQEVDLHARRTQCRDVALELAQALNLNYVFGVEFQELSEGSRAQPAYHGMATLSPWPLSKPRIIRFRDQSTFWKPRWYLPDLPVFQRRIGGRMALVAEAAIYARKLISYNLHLESKGAGELRLRQLNEVLADCRRQPDRLRLVVAGDFNLNAGAGLPGRMVADAGLHDAVRLPGHPTSISHGPSHHASTIDWIFVSNTADSQGRVHTEIHASDHYPVSATLAQPRGFFW
jgi:endonuclease/exonuclease/phosphatase family metal-dependent hydrolase